MKLKNFNVHRVYFQRNSAILNIKNIYFWNQIDLTTAKLIPDELKMVTDATAIFIDAKKRNITLNCQII